MASTALMSIMVLCSNRWDVRRRAALCGAARGCYSVRQASRSTRLASLFIEPSHFVDHIAEIEDIKQHLFIVTFFKNIDLRLQLVGRRFLLHIADDVSVDLQSLRVEG